MLTDSFKLLQEINNLIEYKLPLYDRHHISNGIFSFGQYECMMRTFEAEMLSAWSRLGLYDVHKSVKPGTNQFIVVANLPSGVFEITRNICRWDMYDVPERDELSFREQGNTVYGQSDKVFALIEERAKKRGRQIESTESDIYVRVSSIRRAGIKNRVIFCVDDLNDFDNKIKKARERLEKELNEIPHNQ